MKKLTTTFIILFLFTYPAFADFIDVAYWTAHEAGKALKDAKDALYQDTQIANTINVIGQLKKNYDQATQFAADVKEYQNNPNKLLSDNINAFNKGFGDPVADLNGRINAAEQKESYLDKLHNSAITAESNFVNKNVKVAEYVKEKVDQHNKWLAKASSDLASDDKNTVDSGKNLIALATATALVNIETLLANYLEAAANQQKQQVTDYAVLRGSYTSTLRSTVSNLKYFNSQSRQTELLKRIKQDPGRAPAGNQ